jgi:hypothetical protein
VKPKNIDLSNASVLEVAYLQTGSLRRAARVAAFVFAWGKVRRELGREPSMEEYAAWWRESNATAYREQALFREVFPQLHDPGPILDLLEARRGQVADFRPFVVTA